MTTTTAQNRAIKATLSKAFPGIKVTVRGDRGTAAGYISAHVHYAPASFAVSDQLAALAVTLLERAGGGSCPPLHRRHLPGRHH